MDSFWESVWAGEKVEDYKRYISLNHDCKFIDIFRQNNILNVCDAACGFGRYSAILSSNGFRVSGFDISESSVNLTKDMLNEFNLKFADFCVCSITDIVYEDESFDGLVAHSVIDHLTSAEAIKALNELFRIVKENGLIFLSFDSLEDDDISMDHEVLEDGSFKYTNGSRKDMIFKYYTDEEINKLILGRKVLYFNTSKNGEREIILKKE